MDIAITRHFTVRIVQNSDALHRKIRNHKKRLLSKSFFSLFKLYIVCQFALGGVVACKNLYTRIYCFCRLSADNYAGNVAIDLFKHKGVAEMNKGRNSVCELEGSYF